MAFNVRNEATIALARQLAAERGTSIAAVIDLAVREQAAAADRARAARLERVLELAADARSRMSETFLAQRDPIDSLLFDPDSGLPA